MRGLNTKLKYFRQSLLTLGSDFIAVTESFLSASVENPEVTDGGWSVIRRDRSTGHGGGGVLLAARPGIIMRRRLELETLTGEDLWVSLATEKITCHVCVVYIHPRAKDDVYMCFFQKVESIIASLKGAVIICGDLNLNPIRTSLSILSYYCYFLNVCGLTEMNEVVNAYGGKLDVILVTESIRGAKVLEIEGGGLVPHRDNYHPPLEIRLDIEVGVPEAVYMEPSNVDSGQDWHFAKGNYELLYQLLSEECWLDVLRASDVDTAITAFYNIIYDVFNSCIPRRTRSSTPSRQYPVWFTAEIIKNLKRKAVLHRLWKSSSDVTIYRMFSQLRADIKRDMSVAYDDYIDRIQINLARNPQAFWRHVDGLKTKGGFEAKVCYEGRECVGSDAANAFAKYFSSVFLSEVPLLNHETGPCFDVDQLSRSANYVHVDTISLSELEAALKNFKPKTSIGPDNLPGYIIKGCSEQLKCPVLHIFNLSLSMGRFPNKWKLTRVTPIPKTNNFSCVENYRPIAILSSLAKLFESIIHKRIAAQLKPFLSDSQHGFRPNRSVDSNLLTLT